jgi:uncharacterized protein (DUF305 family)
VYDAATFDYLVAESPIANITAVTLQPTMAPTAHPTIDGYAMAERKVELAVVSTALSFPLSREEASHAVMKYSIEKGFAASLGLAAEACKITSIGGTSVRGRRRLDDITQERRLGGMEIEFDIYSASSNTTQIEALKASIVSAAEEGSLVANVQAEASSNGVLVAALQNMSRVLATPTLIQATKMIIVVELIRANTPAPTVTPPPSKGPTGAPTVSGLDLSIAEAASYNSMSPMFTGCGQHGLKSSKKYALLNYQMHESMAINFTGNQEYDFIAGMIPHHEGASKMCDVYANSTSNEIPPGDQLARNEAICCGEQSLCYNITNGPTKQGQFQDDFSQTGETDQMYTVLETSGWMDHYNAQCTGMSADERDAASVAASGSSGMHGTAHSSMFMGCGELERNSTKEYLALNMMMHTKMALNFTGDAAVDFLLGMIPHHEAAVGMCNVYFKYWPCAPGDAVCEDPQSDEEVATLINQGSVDQVTTLNYMRHICKLHILTTQPVEVRWMKAELDRLWEGGLAELEKDTPCQMVSMHSGDGEDEYGGGHGGMGMGGNSSDDHSGHVCNVSRASALQLERCSGGIKVACMASLAVHSTAAGRRNALCAAGESCDALYACLETALAEAGCEHEAQLRSKLHGLRSVCAQGEDDFARSAGPCVDQAALEAECGAPPS